MKLFRPEKAQGDLNNEFKGGNEDVARLSPVLSALKKKKKKKTCGPYFSVLLSRILADVPLNAVNIYACG